MKQSKPKRTRKVKSKKLTDLECNIKFLEQKEILFPIEKVQLANYKERQAFLSGDVNLKP